MLFRWINGHAEKFTFGQRVCGLTHKNLRPVTCDIQPQEVIGYLQHNPVGRLKQYLWSLDRALAKRADG